MKIRIFSQLYAVFYAVFCASAGLLPPAIQAQECDTHNAGTAPELDQRSQRLVDALTGRITDENKRINILYHAARNTDADGGVQYFLAQRALLAVSGELLEAENFDKARDLLGSVEVDSPVAVEAALLLSDSWRMQGNRKKARDWYLRAGRQFPHELLALEGMLAAAHTMETAAPGIAATLYDQVYEGAMNSSEILEEIPQEKMASGLNWLLSGEHALPAALHSQLSQRILSRGKQSLMTLEAQREDSAISLRCIIGRAGDLEQAHSRIAGKMATLERSIRAIEARITQLDQRIQALEARVTPGEMNDTQVKLRRELVRRKNEIKRLEGQRLFLQQNRERLPKMLRQLRQRIETLYAQQHKENRQADQAIHSLVELSVKDLRNDFLDVAGTSRDNKARLIQEAADN